MTNYEAILLYHSQGNTTTQIATICQCSRREEKVELTAKEYLEIVGDKKADKYKREPTAMDEYREQQSDDDKKWNAVAVSENAVIANYKDSTLFKMPKGDYAGFVYYIPSGSGNGSGKDGK